MSEAYPVITLLRARSRLEAMDWSLVLISQGIESTILPNADGPGWAVEISANDFQRAQKAIGLYRAENRVSRLRREFQPGLFFDWVSLAWVGLVCGFFWLNATRVDLEGPGVLDTAALAQGQWWRLFTAIWLHADLAHLASNATFGVVLLGLAMGRYGTGVALMAAYLAGACGNLMSWAFSPHAHQGLGASGMVMGCLGLLTIQSMAMWRHSSGAAKEFLAGLFGGVMLFVMLGLTPGTDVVAHFGGFASGLVLGAAMAPVLRLFRRPLANLVSTVSFSGLVLVPWWLALTHHK